MKKVTYLIALVLLLTGSAMAQRADDGALGSDQGVSAQMGFSAEGIETSKGTYDVVNDKIWGNTFALNGSNRSETYHFTISMDYIQGKPGQDNSIASGSWTLAVYKGGVFTGALFGDIAGGYISWKTDRGGNIVSRYTAGKLNVLGGKGAFEGVTGDIDGVFSATSETGDRKPTVNATVEIEF